MPDETLYSTDIVTWSRQQAERLRRHVAGERVNDLDWEHVIEEIEDLGNSEMAQGTSLLLQAMIHALKAARWPTGTAVLHWRGEAATCLLQAQIRYRPGMARTIALDDLYGKARRLVLATDQDVPPHPIPDSLALTLTELTDESADLRALVDALGGRPAG